MILYLSNYEIEELVNDYYSYNNINREENISINEIAYILETIFGIDGKECLKFEFIQGKNNNIIGVNILYKENKILKL